MRYITFFVKHNVKLQQFEGPFDLLLSLIDDEKLSLSELSLSNVTEQFLVHLDTLEENRAEELADFLVVAARLLLLKSKMLLPQFSPEEEEGPGLEEQLRLYKAFVDASKKLNKRWLSSLRSVFREEPPRERTGFTPPEDVTLERLHTSMLQLIHRLAPPKPLPTTHIDKAVSMKERLDIIRNMLKSKKSFNFHDVLSSARNKTEVIVSFLALLELVKQRTVSLSQDDNFTDIVIERV